MKKRFGPRPGAVALVPLLLLLSAGQALASTPPTGYSVQDLGVLGNGGYGTRALGLNGSGTVVGFSGGAPCTLNGFVWNGSLQHIPDGTACSSAYAINASGQIAGSLDFSHGGGCYHAFRMTGGNLMPLPGLGGFQCSDGYAINASGQVAGRASNVPNVLVFRPVLWDGAGSQATDLGSLGGSQGWALGINSAGLVVGTSATPTTSGTNWDPGDAFLWDGAIHNLNVLNRTGGWQLKKASAINDAGQIVGYGVGPAHVVHAFRFNLGVNNTTEDLGTFPNGGMSYALGVNRSGDVVGAAYLDATGAGNIRAFVYTSGGGMVNLNDLIPSGSGWVLLEATGINDRGQVSGWGFSNGDAHPFLLTPKPAIQADGTVIQQPPNPDPIAVLSVHGSYFTPGGGVRVRVNGAVAGSRVAGFDGGFTFGKRGVECDTDLEVTAEDMTTHVVSEPVTAHIVCQ